MNDAFQQTIDTLERLDLGTTERMVTLADYSFAYTEGRPVLQNERTSDTLFFSATTNHAMKQYCQLVGIPFAYVKKCLLHEQDLNVLNFGRWSPKKLKKDNLVKIRIFPDAPDKQIIRAILPTNYVTLSNLDLFKTVASVFGDDCKLLGVDTLNADEPVFHARISLPDAVGSDDDPCYVGVSITGSELGANSNEIEINSLLYRQICANGAISLYDESPYFAQKYKGIQPSDLQGVLFSVSKRLRTDIDFYKEKVASAMSELIDEKVIKDFITSLRTRRNVSHDFVDDVEEAVLGNPDCFPTTWHLVNVVTEKARDLPNLNQRVFYESLGGDLLGISVRRMAGDPAGPTPVSKDSSPDDF